MRSAKMIDGSEKRKRQLAFELQNSRVYEKSSKCVVRIQFSDALNRRLTRLRR